MKEEEEEKEEDKEEEKEEEKEKENEEEEKRVDLQGQDGGQDGYGLGVAQDGGHGEHGVRRPAEAEHPHHHQHLGARLGCSKEPKTIIRITITFCTTITMTTRMYTTTSPRLTICTTFHCRCMALRRIPVDLIDRAFWTSKCT